MVQTPRRSRRGRRSPDAGQVPNPGGHPRPHPHSQVSASNKASDRRSVDSDGSTWSAPIPKRDSSSRPASWIHSAIPSSVRAPANTAVVAALAGMSSLLIMDEPTTDLDPLKWCFRIASTANARGTHRVGVQPNPAIASPCPQEAERAGGQPDLTARRRSRRTPVPMTQRPRPMRRIESSGIGYWTDCGRSCAPRPSPRQGRIAVRRRLDGAGAGAGHF